MGRIPSMDLISKIISPSISRSMIYVCWAPRRNKLMELEPSTQPSDFSVLILLPDSDDRRIRGPGPCFMNRNARI